MSRAFYDFLNFVGQSFEGVCLTTVILAPGASEGGLGAAALAPLCPDPAKCRDPGMNPARSLFLRRLRTSEPKAWNWVAISDKYTQIFQNLIKNYLKCQSLKKRVVFDFVLSPKGACHSHGGIFLQKWGPTGSHRVRCSYSRRKHC